MLKIWGGGVAGFLVKLFSPAVLLKVFCWQDCLCKWELWV